MVEVRRSSTMSCETRINAKEGDVCLVALSVHQLVVSTLRLKKNLRKLNNRKGAWFYHDNARLHIYLVTHQKLREWRFDASTVLSGFCSDIILYVPVSAKLLLVFHINKCTLTNMKITERIFLQLLIFLIISIHFSVIFFSFRFFSCTYQTFTLIHLITNTKCYNITNDEDNGNNIF